MDKDKIQGLRIVTTRDAPIEKTENELAEKYFLKLTPFFIPIRYEGGVDLLASVLATLALWTPVVIVFYALFYYALFSY